MKNIVSNYLKKFRRERRERRKFVGLLVALALAVTVGVGWQLHSTGIAMTNETYCGMEEHQHSADCYEEVLVCGLEESDGHTHTDDCYEKQLVCGIEEHTHTVECLMDETADVETASDWEATLPDLTGDQAKDAVSIAVSQVDYTESTANFTLADDGETRQGYTRYGEWYGNEYGDWDAMFVSFCLHYAGVDEEDFPEASGAYAWSVELEKKDLYEDASGYTPAIGDLVFFDTDNDGKIDRTGIVEKMDTTTDAEGEETVTKLYVIEGDYAKNADDTDAVCEVKYQPDDETIIGYGTASAVYEITAVDAEEADTEEEEATEEAEAEYEAAVLTCEGDDYTVTVSYDEDAELPQGTELVVSEYDTDSEIWQNRYEEASALYGWEEEHSFRLFNISLIADGEEVEPAAEVSVVISFPDQEETEYTLTHYTGQDAEDISVVSDLEDGTHSISFETDGFSDFSLASADTTDFAVEYYAYLDVIQTGTSGMLEVLDTSAAANGGAAKTPLNTTSNAKTYINLEDNGNGKYKIVTASELTQIYSLDHYDVEHYPDVSSINKLSENAGYTLCEVWVSTDNGTKWDTYTYNNSMGMIFTNVEDSADVDEGIIYIPDDALVRLVYNTGSSEKNIAANLYDYDITSDGTNTNQNGINSSTNYSGTGTKLAFGNNNTGTGLFTLTWNGYTLNKTNSGSDKGCTFGLVSGLVSGKIVYSSGVSAPNLFNEGDATGKTSYEGQNLTFSQVGDTYTLTTVSGSGKVSATDLQYFTHLTGYTNEVSGSFNIYTNNFWPMDSITNTDGSHGDSLQYKNGTDKWNNGTTSGNWPISDDSEDHNSYFGMQFAVDFELDGHYVGPLNYYFFGDDDMWVFLTNKTTGSSTLVCDIGGVHSSVGEYVNLWDYIDSDDSAGSYTLTFFYTERGASGSTCYMQFTLPSVTTATTVQDTGSLKVEKAVDSDEATENETFAFELGLTDSAGMALTNTYSYDVYNETNVLVSSGTVKNGDSFTLSDGQYIIVHYLPVNTKCTVTETTTGYTTYYTVGSDSLKEGAAGSGSITDGDTLSMKFINSTPDVDKEVQDSDGDWGDYNTAGVGETVQFQTTIKDVSGVTNLVLHDKLSDGLANPNVISATVYTNGTETPKATLALDTDYSVTNNTSDGCSFEINFITASDILKGLTADDYIVVCYSAVVTEKAVIGNDGYPQSESDTPEKGNLNETYISYGASSTSEKDYTHTYVYEVNLYKYYNETSLSGAEFILYYTKEISSAAGEDPQTVYYYAQVNSENVIIGWTTDRSEADTMTSDKDGMIYIQGVGPGTYYLEETTPPDGYSLLDEPILIVVDEDGAVTYGSESTGVTGATTSAGAHELSDGSTVNYTVLVENEPGYELPLTGGFGTLPFVMAGLLLISGGAYLLYRTQKRRKEEIY